MPALWQQRKRWRRKTEAGQAAWDSILIQLMPEDRGLLRLLIEKVLEKPRRVQGRRIGILLAVITDVSQPVGWPLAVDHIEQRARIHIGLTQIVEYPKVVGLDPNHEVRLIRRQNQRLLRAVHEGIEDGQTPMDVPTMLHVLAKQRGATGIECRCNNQAVPVTECMAYP